MNKLLRAHRKGPAAPPQHLLLSPEGSFNFISIIKDSLVQSANEASAVRLQRVACPGCCELLGCPRSPLDSPGAAPDQLLRQACSERLSSSAEVRRDRRADSCLWELMWVKGTLWGGAAGSNVGSRQQLPCPGRDGGQGPDLGLPAQK